MASSAPDIAEDVIDVEELNGAPEKGHRYLDDIWLYYKKIKLPAEQSKFLHRNYDGKCKCCN